MSDLPSELLSRSQSVLSRCVEFQTDASLRSIFITTELAPFRNGLPGANTIIERIGLCLDYLLPKRLSGGRPVLPLFLTTLRDRYQAGDSLRDELDALARAVSEAEHLVQRARGEVQLIVSGDASNFTDERRDILIGVVASVLQVARSDIRILRVEPGSIRIVIEIPESALIKLTALSAAEKSALANAGVTSIDVRKTKIQVQHDADTTAVDFVIVTALEEERDAVLSKLPAYQRLRPTENDVRVYYAATLPVVFPDGSTGEYQLIVMPLLGMGRLQAATATSDAIRRWRPHHVMLVGIAGGVAAKKVKLGDVLTSDQIVDYELQKLTPDGLEVRWSVHQADPRLLGASQNMIGTEWQRHIAVARPGEEQPVRHKGPIASGDKVVAFGDVLARYRQHWPTLVGVEMEAAGVATACFQAADPPGFFMVRGVSDLADEKKGTESVEQWRPYACDVAATYAIELLKSGPVTPILGETSR